MPKQSRFRTGIALAKISWRTLRDNKSLMAFPIAGMAVALAIAIILVLPGIILIVLGIAMAGGTSAAAGIALAVVGGLFVLETLSVVIQVMSFKWTGKRVFKMAPLHHHYEQKGWKESTVVIRFWIISVILALIGLSTLKLR